MIRVDLSHMNAMVDYGPDSLNLGRVGEEQETRVDHKLDAQETINRVDTAIERVNSYRASLGAIQNRLSHAVSNTSAMIENTEAAKSRILDADYAEESSQVVQMGILQRAGISVLSQANQIPEMALKLLG